MEIEIASYVKAIFYCDIKTPKGEIINKDFDFDEGTFQDKTALERYCNYSQKFSLANCLKVSKNSSPVKKKGSVLRF